MTLHPELAEDFASGDAVRCAVVVPLSRDRAFAAFRHDVLIWWPREETWSGSAIEDLYFEGRKGGVLWERGPDGFRLDMARVLRWMASDRIVLRWHIGPGRVPEPDPAKASEVEIRFEATEEGTRIALEHRLFARHGAAGEAYRIRMGSEAGWPRILDCFAEHCGPSRRTAPAVRANAAPQPIPEFVG